MHMHSEKGKVAIIRRYEMMVRTIAQHPGPSGFAVRQKKKKKEKISTLK